MRVYKLLAIWIAISSFIQVNGQGTLAKSAIIDLSDTVLRSILTDYISKHRESFEKVGVPIVKPARMGDTLTYYISYIIYQHELINDPPLHYTVIDNIPVLLYTGFEHLYYFNISDFKLACDRLYKKSMNITYSPAVWKITLIKGEVVGKVLIDKLPY